MSYTNRKRKKKRGESRSFFAISVIVCGMLIYALYVSSAGKWIMENYIQPVFIESVPKDTEGSEQIYEDVTEQTTEKQKENQQTVSYEGFTVYAMQIGAYSSKDNAAAAAAEIKARGGAGYVHHDGMYRVLAFGYATESEANNVKEQLKAAASMDAGIYTITVPRLDFKATGEEKNIRAVDNAFKTFLQVKDKMGELTVKLDKGELDKDGALKEVKALESELKSAVKDIDKLSESDEKLNKFYNMCNEITAMLEKIGDSDATVMSANIKNVYMEMVCRYSAYVKEISTS